MSAPATPPARGLPSGLTFPPAWFEAWVEEPKVLPTKEEEEEKKKQLEEDELAVQKMRRQLEIERILEEGMECKLLVYPN
jgi:hypothetical protein